MNENLVGYLLNSLDEETHRQVEDHLRTNAEARHKLEQLRRVVEPLAVDVEPEEPPSGLWIRTLAHIAEDRCRRLPASPRPVTVTSGATSRAWWRRADLLVAASILVLAVGVSIPWLLKLRHDNQVTACANNLREVHKALVGYSALHNNQFPQVESQPPRNIAGIYVPALRDAKLWTDSISVGCPANGSRPPSTKTMAELESLFHNDPQGFTELAKDLGGCYAYSLGYRQPNAAGQTDHQGLRSDSGDWAPIMADGPPFKVGNYNGGPGNSTNHGGKGQNVLHVGGHVTWRTDRTIGEDDLYLNHEKKVGAGNGIKDVVLGASWASPYPNRAD